MSVGRIYLEAVAEGTQLIFRCTACKRTRLLTEFYAKQVRPRELSCININSLLQMMGEFMKEHADCQIEGEGLKVFP